VLDRANVLAFNEVDAQRFLEGGGEPAASTFRLADGTLEPAEFADRSSLNTAALARGKDSASFAEALVGAHELLKSHNLHFGYRVLNEITTFVGHALERVSGDPDEIAATAFDLQLVQKVLPKLNGGRELEAPLAQLLGFCLDGSTSGTVDPATVVEQATRRLSGQPAPTPPPEEAEGEGNTDTPTEPVQQTAAPSPPAYPRAARELARMLVRLRQTGFVSYLE
jgi:hypothetical protein